VFVPIAGVPQNALVMIGNVSDSDSDDDGGPDEESEDEEWTPDEALSGYASDDGFVVPDDEEDEEPFSLANPDNDAFVADMHNAVRAYDEWVPQTREGKRFRKWMEAFEAKIAHKDDEQQFSKGTHVDYARPPAAKRSKTA